MEQNHRSGAGFTLMELLMVIAIMGVLASLLLGAVFRAHSRAKDTTWRLEADSLVGYIQQHLSRYYQSQTNYPMLSAAELYQRHVFDDRIMDFLQCPHVQYIPFSMGDGDDKYILMVDNYWVLKLEPVPGHCNDLILRKKDVTKPDESQ